MILMMNQMSIMLKKTNMINDNAGGSNESDDFFILKIRNVPGNHSESPVAGTLPVSIQDY